MLRKCSVRPCGLMDKAPDFGSGDCRFESCHGRLEILLLLGSQNILLQVRVEFTTTAYLCVLSMSTMRHWSQLLTWTNVGVLFFNDRCATESMFWCFTEIWTWIAGFKVQSANHYTIEPYDILFYSYCNHDWNPRIYSLDILSGMYSETMWPNG